MVEGDLLDLTVPTLVQAMARERSTSVLRLNHGEQHGALYFCEGALVHAVADGATGDEAVSALLGWTDGRFQLVRDADRQPRTVTRQIEAFLQDGHAAGSQGSGDAEPSGDERLLSELLTLLSRLEQDRARLADHHSKSGGVPVLVALATVVNSVIAFVTTRSSDPNVLPSHVLPRLAEKQPYTQLLGEDNGRLSVATVADVLKNWSDDEAEREKLLHDLSRALLDVLTWYGEAAGTFFHESREREEWRATFEVFVEGLWSAIQHGKAHA
jgi:Domain of unknown function (DUF4388)